MSSVPDVAPRDPELQVIIAVLTHLNTLEYAARIRVLNYIGARMNKDFD